MSDLPGGACQWREKGRQAARDGRAADACRAFERVLDEVPSDVEAMSFLGMHALASGDLSRARGLLAGAFALAPEDGPTRKNLAILELQTGRHDEAVDLLTGALDLDPGFFVARLYLALAFERAGRPDQALVHYFRALSSAQALGQWTNPATTAAGLRPTVERAARFVLLHRARVLEAVMAPLRKAHGAAALARVEQCLANYLGKARHPPQDGRQRPSFLYFPGLPATPYFPRNLFPWYRELEDATAAIREEMLDVLADERALVPFLGTPDEGTKSSYLASDGDAAPQWDGLFFHRHGKRNESACARCPVTSRSLDASPIVRIRGHAPEALFSVLGPGSHILPHTGVTNTRVVTHLPLVVPDSCALRVAGVDHAWQEGRAITFDDTFEHEAWNRSRRLRVILLFDVWNPHLTDVEQAAVTAIVEAIGDLHSDHV